MSEVDEELSTGTGPWWSAGDGRRSVVLITGLVVAVGLAGWIVAAQRGGGTSSADRPPPAATTETEFVPLQPDDAVFHRCPPPLDCNTTESVSSATTAAIAQYLPGAYERKTVTVTEVGRHRLHYRAVNATSGALELLIIVSVPQVVRPDAVRTADPRPGAAIRYVRRLDGPLEIQVQYTGPPGATPSVQQAGRLAADPRLLALD